MVQCKYGVAFHERRNLGKSWLCLEDRTRSETGHDTSAAKRTIIVTPVPRGSCIFLVGAVREVSIESIDSLIVESSVISRGVCKDEYIAEAVGNVSGSQESKSIQEILSGSAVVCATGANIGSKN
jgi:hypothetical protein